MTTMTTAGERKGTHSTTHARARFLVFFPRVVDIFPGVSSSTSTSSCIMNTYRQSMMICAKFSPLSLVFLSLSEPGASFCYVFFFSGTPYKRGLFLLQPACTANSVSDAHFFKSNYYYILVYSYWFLPFSV